MPFHQAIYLVSVFSSKFTNNTCHYKAPGSPAAVFFWPGGAGITWGWQLMPQQAGCYPTSLRHALCMLCPLLLLHLIMLLPVEPASSTGSCSVPSTLQVVTTLTTVGFGDVVAQTMLGRAVIITTICFGVVAIPVQASAMKKRV